MRTSLYLTPLAFLLAISLPASAGWWWDCHQDPYDFEISPCPESSYDLCYVVNDLCQLDGGCLFSIWIYAEDNGIPGLQRCDDAHTDNCPWADPGCPWPDKVIF